ncbi:hypothetical protein ACI78T_17075 [Blastococcus sp. SYSU D00922]
MTTLPPLADVPVRSADDLTSRWTLLLEPPVFRARSLWLAWLGPDRRMLPIVIPVDDVPLVPEPAMLENLRRLHDSLFESQLGGDGHFAMALCRPGEPVVRGDDEAWVQALSSALDEGQIDGTWSLHLAAGGQVVPMVEAPSRLWSR